MHHQGEKFVAAFLEGFHVRHVKFSVDVRGRWWGWLWDGVRGGEEVGNVQRGGGNL